MKVEEIIESLIKQNDQQFEIIKTIIEQLKLHEEKMNLLQKLLSVKWRWEF